MKKLGAILIAVVLFAPVAVHAQTPLTNEFQNLNDNQVPPGWVYEDWGCCGGIQDGRLWARVVDAYQRLKRVGTMPQGATSLKLSYDGNMAYSYWGFSNGIEVNCGSHTFVVGSSMSQYNWGLYHKVRIYMDGYVWQNPDPNTTFYDQNLPLEYTDYHYEAEFSEGQIKWKATKISNGSVAFDVTVAVPLLHIADFQQMYFSAYTTTNSDSWIDNIGVEVVGSQPPGLKLGLLVRNAAALDGEEQAAFNFATGRGFTVTKIDPTMIVSNPSILDAPDCYWAATNAVPSAYSNATVTSALKARIESGKGLVVTWYGMYLVGYLGYGTSGMGSAWSPAVSDHEYWVSHIDDHPVFSNLADWIPPVGPPDDNSKLIAYDTPGYIPAGPSATFAAPVLTPRYAHILATYGWSGQNVNPSLCSQFGITCTNQRSVHISTLVEKSVGNGRVLFGLYSMAGYDHWTYGPMGYQMMENILRYAGSGGQPPQTNVTISGTVTRNGSPMSGVVVTATGVQVHSYITGQDGTYNLSVPKGSYVIDATKQDCTDCQFYPRINMDVYVATIQDFLEDHQGPNITIAANCNYADQPEVTYNFLIEANEAQTGNAPIVELSASFAGTLLPVSIPGNTSYVSVPIPLILLSYGAGDYSLTVAASDRWGHQTTQSLPVAIRKSGFVPSTHGFHFKNYGLLGSCFGMSAASVWYKAAGLDLFNLPDNNYACGDCNCAVPPWYSPVRRLISVFDPYSFGWGIPALYNGVTRIEDLSLGGDLRSMMESEFRQIRGKMESSKSPILYLLNTNTAAGHAGVGYATVEIGESKYVHVYNPNYPYELEATGTACKHRTEPIRIPSDYTPGSFVYESYNAFGEIAVATEGANLGGDVAGTAARGTYSFSQSLREVTERGLSGLYGLGSGAAQQLGSWIHIGSPVSVMITDASGRRLGFVDGGLICEIPGAEGKRLAGELEDFYVPGGERYTVQCTGVATGILHQSIYYPNRDSTINSSFFEVPVTPGMVLSTDVGPSTDCMVMSVDSAGDGFYESSHLPLRCELNWAVPDTVYTCGARAAGSWFTSWFYHPRPRARCFIGNLPVGFSISDLIPLSIRLNETVSALEGEYRVLPGAAGFAGPVLEVSFDGAEALRSLGEVATGDENVVLLSGRLTNKSMFFAQATVRIAEGPGYASLSGLVSDNLAGGLLGVSVDVYDSLGTLWQSVVTNDSGYYHIDSMPNGHYSASIVTPIGYKADQETQAFTIHHVPVTVNFNLTKQNVAVAPRGLGYWTHQVNALPCGRGKPQESLSDMCRYMELIRTHFNDNRLNPVDIFNVDLNADCNARLRALRAVLSPKACDGESDKAKAHLTALLLNMVSGKIPQWTRVSRDSITVSQAITYCNYLITGDVLCADDEDNYHGHEADHDRGHEGGRRRETAKQSRRACLELAREIAEDINDGERIGRGVVPPDVMNIAYRPSAGPSTVPSEFALGQNYPNPFNASTVIHYNLGGDVLTKLEVFDILGRHVRTLIDEFQPAGTHEITWDGTDAHGQAVSSGMYFYRLTTGRYTESRKMVLLK